jgi:hypothetical protein
MIYKRRRNKFGLNFNRYTNRVFFNTDPAAGGAGGGGAPSPAAAPAAGSDAGGTPAAGGSNPGVSVTVTDSTVSAGGGTDNAINADPNAKPADAAKGQDGKAPDTTAPDMAKLFGDLYKDPALQQFKTPEDVAKAFIETKKLVGAKPLKIPGADATEEERKAFNDQYRATMVPPDPKGYDFKKPEGIAPELEQLFSEEGLGAFASEAHKLGLTKAQAEGLITFDRARNEAALQSAGQGVQAREASFMEGFKKQHGANAEKVLDTSIGLITDVATKEDSDTIAGATEAQRMAFANVLNKLAQKYIGEDNLPGKGNGNAGKSVADLKQELNATIASPAYRDEFSADHANTKARAKQLSEQIALGSKKR